MERNSEFYRPREKDQAFHPMPGCPEACQWWFHDGIFTNGFCLQLMYYITHSKASIWFHVCDSDGNFTKLMPVFHTTAVVASTETCDVRIGDNRMHGKFPRYELHFRSDDTGADLVYECLTQGFMEPPDGVFLGREQCPATPIYVSYICRPRCRITGKLVIGGKEIPVNGEGYADHQWKNAGIGEFQFHFWNWGKIYLPKHTIVWQDAQLSQSFGYQRAKWLWALKGEKLIEYLKNADMYVKLDDLEIEPESGVTYPRKMVLMIDERKIKGTATYKVKRLIHNFPIGPGQQFGLRRYFCYLSDCHSEFEIEGEKIVADSREIIDIGL
ncbi:MAG: hypothetical protein KKC46_08825 [Proteobacteria bacterium]|nr:hypothetical protein [Pseudomonadota bacterium]